ncbi:MAG: hypothetical protein ACP5UV_06375 [Thermoplasmata archaeon]
MDVEKANSKILDGKAHCDAILINNKRIFMIELKNTENVGSTDIIEELLKKIIAKYDGSWSVLESVNGQLLDKRKPLIQIEYIAFIAKNTFDKFLKNRALVNRLKYIFGAVPKSVNYICLKECETDLYDNGNNNTIKIR